MPKRIGVTFRSDKSALHGGRMRDLPMKTASQCSTLAVVFAPHVVHGEQRAHAALTQHGHINNLLDGEIRNGNCEESCETRSKEGPGQEGRTGQESSGKEGCSREEGRSGQEGGSC